MCEGAHGRTYMCVGETGALTHKWRGLQESVWGQFQLLLLPKERRDRERWKEGMLIRFPEERDCGGRHQGAGGRDGELI